MVDAASIQSARGLYAVRVMETQGAAAGPITVAVEHQGGLEKFGFRCTIEPVLWERSGLKDPGQIAPLMARWLEKQFEQVREAALKSVRAERKLLEVAFDSAQPGPF